MNEPLDLSNRKDVRRLQKLSAQVEARRRDVIRAIMAEVAGREWIWDLLTRAHVFQTSFQGEAPFSMAFLEGERNQGLRLLNDIMTFCPERYVQMTQEANTSQQEPTNDERGPDQSDASDESGSEYA